MQRGAGSLKVAKLGSVTSGDWLHELATPHPMLCATEQPEVHVETCEVQIMCSAPFHRARRFMEQHSLGHRPASLHQIILTTGTTVGVEELGSNCLSNATVFVKFFIET